MLFEPHWAPNKKIRRCKASAGTTPYLRICKDQDPRAKQQPTGLIAYSAAGAPEPPCSSPAGHPTNKKSPLLKTADFLVGCPVGLEPTVSRSTIWRVNRLRYGHHIDAPEGTRTPGPLLRRQLLYPTELLAHTVKLERVTGIEPASPAWKAGALAIVLHPHTPSAQIVSSVIIPQLPRICQE